MKFALPTPQFVGQPNLIEVYAQVANAAELDREAIECWAAVMGKLSAFCDVGGFAFDATSGQFGHMGVLSAERLDSNHLRAVLQPQNLHGYAVAAVTNAVGAFHHQVVSLAQARLIAPVNWPKSRSPLLLREQLPFAVEDEREVFANGMDITFAFRNELSVAIAERTEQAFGAWFSCVNLGAFSEDPELAHGSFIYFGEDAKIDGNELMISAGEYLFSEPLAIDGLLSVVSWIHFHLAALSTVSLVDQGG